MFLIATRLLTLLAIAYLFGLIVAWVFSLFDNDDGGDDFRRGDPESPQPPDPNRTLDLDSDKKRLVEIDESYYLAEFDLTSKK